MVQSGVYLVSRTWLLGSVSLTGQGFHVGPNNSNLQSGIVNEILN